jgi:hypothetical protein
LLRHINAGRVGFGQGTGVVSRAGGALFEETAFTNEEMDEFVSLGSWRSQKMHGLYKDTRKNSIRFQVCINNIEQSELVAAENPAAPLPNSGSTTRSPPVVQMSQMDGVSGVVQGL